MRAHSSPTGGVYTFTLGDFTLHMMSDGAVTTAADWMFPSLSAEEVATFPGGRAVLSFGCVLLVAGDLNILLDSSLGREGKPMKFADPKSQVSESRPVQDLRGLLAATGVRPDQIHFVVHTHLHKDHTSWNTLPHPSGEGFVPTFPNAKHVVQDVEVAYWSSNESMRERS